MIDSRITDTLRELLNLEVAADVWDTGNPVLQVIGIKNDVVVRETLAIPDQLVRDSFHASLVMVYSATTILSSLPSSIRDTMEGAQVAGLCVFSETWGLRAEVRGLGRADAAKLQEKLTREIEEAGGLRNHPDATDLKTILFTDGFRHHLFTHTRGQEKMDEFSEDAQEDSDATPTDIALDALARQVKWMLS
jgi:hypothetical protein